MIDCYKDFFNCIKTCTIIFITEITLEVNYCYAMLKDVRISYCKKKMYHIISYILFYTQIYLFNYNIILVYL